MRSAISSTTAIPGSAGRASRRQAVRSFGGCVRGLLAGSVLAGCDSGVLARVAGLGFLGCRAVRFSQCGLLGVC